MESECALTAGGAAVGVMAGIRSSSVVPQAGVSLAVRARGVNGGSVELRRAAAGAHRAVTGQEPATDCWRKKHVLNMQ